MRYDLPQTLPAHVQAAVRVAGEVADADALWDAEDTSRPEPPSAANIHYSIAMIGTRERTRVKP